MKNQKSVFEFGNEFVCTEFFDVDTQCGGVDVSRDGEHLGSILCLTIPDLEDEVECKMFDEEVISWVVDNGH